MTTLATLKTRLDEAQEARHLLMTQSKEVRVQHSPNKSVAYSQSSMADLERYIGRLEDDIARLEGKTRRGRILVDF